MEEEEGRSEKLSDQSEILLHCRLDISNSDSFMALIDIAI